MRPKVLDYSPWPWLLQRSRKGRPTRVLVALFLLVVIIALSVVGTGGVTAAPIDCPVDAPCAVGQWEGPFNTPVVAIHAVVLRTGKVLLWSAGGTATLWDNPSEPDPLLWSFTPVPAPDNIFCAGFCSLADGRVLTIGGHAANNVGINDANIFDPSTETWTEMAPMEGGRWYPTCTILPDGRVLATSGDISPTDRNDLPEVYDPVVNTWVQLEKARLRLPMYPWMFVLPSGKVFDAGPDGDTKTLDVDTQTWTPVDDTNHGSRGTFSPAVMYEPGKILIAGGNDPVNTVTNAVEIIDMNGADPTWQGAASMNYARRQHNLTLLPDGQILVTGGTSGPGFSNQDPGIMEPELFDPSAGTWTEMASMANKRVYHSTAFLLPDGRVVVTGTDDEFTLEIFSPPFLFQADGQLAMRPTILSAPDTIQYGNPFTLTVDPSSISQVALIRPSSVTHSFNMDQRYVRLEILGSDAGTLTVQAPADANLAPPGHYMLFVVDNNGVPSVAAFVRALEAAPAPTVTSVAPTSGPTAGGTPVAITGTNFVSGASVTFGGTAATGVTVVNATTIAATTPAHAAGAVDVVVTNPDSLSGTLASGYIYNVPAALVSFVRSGGVTGTSFSFDIGSAGTDRLVVVIADEESQVTNLTGVTVDTKVCNLVARANNIVGIGNHQEMWYCDEDDLGASNGIVSVAISGGDAGWATHAHLYTHVSQAGPTDFGIDETSASVTTVTVTGIDVPANGLVVMGAAHGMHGTATGWTAPLVERTDSPNPSSALLATASAIESGQQTNKTYVSTMSLSFNRGTGIVAVWPDAQGTPVNNPPVADDQAVTTAEDTPVAITLTWSDPDGDPLTFSVVTPPANGSLSGTAPNLTYTPNADFNGSDSFTFKVNDGAVDSNIATVTITVSAVNDPPVANSQSVAVKENTPKAITLTGSDVDVDPLTFTVVPGPANGTLSGTAPNLNYTPNAGYAGPDTFTFKANDGTVDSNMATVSITVSANNPPVVDNQSVTTAEDTAKAITLTGSDPDGDSLTYNVVTGPANGSLSGAAPNLIYTPNPNFNGSDSFTFKVNDGITDSSPAIVSITVTPVNDPPVANGQSVTTAEDTAKAITLTGSDPDGDSLTYNVVNGPANGSLSGTPPNLTYTPNPDFNGSDNFTFKVNDGITDSNAALVSVTVNPVNDAPVAGDDSATTPEGIAVTIDVLANDSDVDGNALTGANLTQPFNGTASLNADQTVTYTPNAGFTGIDSFTYTSNDGTVDSNVATVSVTVNPASNTDTVTIIKAKYRSKAGKLQLEAESTDPSAVLTAYDANTGAFLGQLNPDGKLNISISLSPADVRVDSDKGGSDTRAVQIK